MHLLHIDMSKEEETALILEIKHHKFNQRMITFTIMSGNFSARSSMLVPPFLQAIIIWKE